MIQIHILRISSDGKFLEFNVECPINYTFNLLEITRYNPETKLDGDIVDFSVALKKTTTVETLRIEAAFLGTPVTFYTVKFGIKRTGTEITQTSIAYCSNVSFVYANMLDLVMQLTASCVSDSDFKNLTRNHLILYAHQEALRLNRVIEAKYFYDILVNNFNNCGSPSRLSGVSIKNCNCP